MRGLSPVGNWVELDTELQAMPDSCILHLNEKMSLQPLEANRLVFRHSSRRRAEASGMLFLL